MDLTTVAQFDSEADAEYAAVQLRGAGITPVYVEGELRVPADQAHHAIQLLNASEELERPGTANAQCPECGSFETRAIPPYAGMYLAALSGAMFLAAWLRSFAAGAPFLVLIAGFPLFQWLSRLSGKERCGKCGWLFTAR